MTTDNNTEEDHCQRSNFIQKLVQRPSGLTERYPMLDKKVPRKIVQFWDNLEQLPNDVSECIETWAKTEQWGIERLLFDKEQAGNFIYQKLGARYKRAFEYCYHPAMQSDYFRLCYIYVEGGCYVDVDDVYTGAEIEHFFIDGRLKIQPLCYDAATHSMVPPQVFTKSGSSADSWIFYFNNNPLIACSNHPIIEHALNQATLSLENTLRNDLPEIQSTAGPGNLTKSIFDIININENIEQTLLILCDWEDIATSKWDLSYRNDARNWRLSNRKSYDK